MRVGNDAIIEEYVKYYQNRRNGETPTEKHMEFFKDEILWDVKRYVQRGFSIFGAIDKVISDRNN
jgi:hypothetical protein